MLNSDSAKSKLHDMMDYMGTDSGHRCNSAIDSTIYDCKPIELQKTEWLDIAKEYEKDLTNTFMMKSLENNQRLGVYLSSVSSTNFSSDSYVVDNCGSTNFIIVVRGGKPSIMT